MVNVNGKDVEWKRAPNFMINVQRQVLWKDEKTGATFAIMKIPKGVYLEQAPHSHPHANQFTFRLSGEIELPNGTHITVSEDDYGFDYCPKDKAHGTFSKGTKVLKDYVYLHYWDGPEDWNDADKTDK